MLKFMRIERLHASNSRHLPISTVTRWTKKTQGGPTRGYVSYDTYAAIRIVCIDDTMSAHTEELQKQGNK